MRYEVERIAGVLALDFSGPAGPIPLERLLRKHHRQLAALREMDLTWEQISRLLAGAGVVRGDGRAFPASHLRGVFGRHRKRDQVNPPKKSAPAAVVSSTAGRARQPVADDVRHPPAGQGRSNPALEGSATARHVAVNGSSSDGNSGTVPARQKGDGQGAEQVGRDDVSTVSDRARVLALMRQSALARRASE